MKLTSNRSAASAVAAVAWLAKNMFLSLNRRSVFSVLKHAARSPLSINPKLGECSAPTPPPASPVPSRGDMAGGRKWKTWSGSNGSLCSFIVSLRTGGYYKDKHTYLFLPFCCEMQTLPSAAKSPVPPGKCLEMGGEFGFHSLALPALWGARLSCRARCCKL